MDKRTKNSLLVIGLLAVTAGALWWLKRRVNKTRNEMDLRNEKIQQTADETYNDEEDTVLDEDGAEVDCKVNLPKELNNLISHDSDYDLDLIDVNEILNDEKVKKSEKVVHILQRYNRAHHRNVLDILFEIPNSALGTGTGRRSYIDSSVSTGNFVEAIRGKWDREEETLRGGILGTLRDKVYEENKVLGAKINKDPIIESKIDGYLILSYEELVDGEWLSGRGMYRVPQELYEDNPFSAGHSKLTEYISDVKVALKEAKKKKEALIIEQKRVMSPERFRNVKILDAFASVRVTLAVKDNWHIDGVNKESLKNIVDYIFEELEVEGANNGSFIYEYLLCYAPDLESEGRIAVYDINGDEVDL